MKYKRVRYTSIYDDEKQNIKKGLALVIALRSGRFAGRFASSDGTSFCTFFAKKKQ